MKNLNKFIFEKLSIKLDDSFIDDLDYLIDDYEPKFKSEYSLDFLYNIFNAAMPEKAEVSHTAYNDRGKRIDDDMQMLTIKCGRNYFKIYEDNNGQLAFKDNDTFIDAWGLPSRNTETMFGLDLIKEVFDNRKCKNFKIETKDIDIKNFGKIVKINSINGLRSSIKKYVIPNYEVYDGSIRKDDNLSDSLSNFLDITIIKPEDKNFEPYYYVNGVGMHGSKKKYSGNNELEFISTYDDLTKEHLHA